MSFSKETKETALVSSRRCCCVCHEFSGLYTNVHHIVPAAEGGPDSLENAIVLCLRCHGEAGHYNSAHPIGNKYSRDELRRHRDEWWRWCEANPTRPLPSGPISISPNAFRLVAGKWQTRVVLKLNNRTDEPLFDIAIKCSIMVQGISAQDIKLEYKSTSFELTHRLKDVEFAGDMFRLDGTDAAGKPVFFVYLHHIDPHAVVTFSLTNAARDIPEPQFTQHAILSLMGFSEEPSEMLVNENQAAVRFKAYEDWQITGMQLLLRRRM